jgi:hypothetical protein
MGILMKKFLRNILALAVLLSATSASAWFGGNNGNNGGNNWAPWNSNGGNWGPWNGGGNRGGNNWNNNGYNNGYYGNQYDEWDPRYWMEEMEDFFDGGNNYGNYNRGPYNNYTPYGGGYGNGPYGPPQGYYRPYPGQNAQPQQVPNNVPGQVPQPPAPAN